MKKTSWYFSKWAIIGFHVLAWLVWFLMPYLMQPGGPRGDHFKMTPEMIELLSKNGQPVMPFRRPPNESTLHHIRFVQNIILVIIFYTNAFMLIPSLLYQKKIGKYIGAIVAAMFFYFIVSIIMHYAFGESEGIFFGPHIFSLFFFLFIWALSTIYRLGNDKIKAEGLKKDRENAHLITELSFLRSQISPHFIFNVLNNMVSLARKKSDMLEPSLIKLSSLMRYMLYESDADKVFLEKEMEYLQSYVELQQQRFADSVEVCMQMSVDKPGYEIEPMLLIPFVENAFKHGASLVVAPQINISLQVKDSKLLMEVRNKFNNISIESKDKTSGIGLKNVKRRLDLLYHTNHHLLVRKEEGWFCVLLQLNLT